MAASTAIVVTAGSLSALDVILNDNGDQQRLIKIGVATVGAALVSAGLDKVAPGFGKGIGVVLLFGVVLTSGPRIASKINLTSK